MKSLLFSIPLFFLFFRVSLSADCTQDPYCTSCAGSTSACSACTYNTTEGDLFGILQPDGTCYAKDPTNWQTGVYGSDIYMCNDGCTTCGSGGVCTACEKIHQLTVNYRQYTITYDGSTHCTHDCGMFPGYTNGTSGTTCSACPANCFNCSTPTLCQDCSYNIKRFNGLTNRFDISFSKGNIGTGYINCDATQTRNTNLLSLTYYLSPDPVTCGTTCAGTFAQPFGDINDILYNLVDAAGADIYSYKEVQFTLLLLNGVTTSTHYWTYISTYQTHLYTVFNRVSAQVTIQPAIYSATGTCNDPAICYAMDASGNMASKPLVMWKNPYLKLYVTKSLTIKNVIFDGADMVMYTGAYNANGAAKLLDAALTTKGRFCLDQSTEDTIQLVPNPDYSQNQICSMVSATGTKLTVPLPAEFTLETVGGAFIMMTFLSDYSSAAVPQLIMTNCEVRNFWFMVKNKAFISMDHWGSRVNISSTKFVNFMFVDGILTNTNHIFEKAFVLNRNVHDNRKVYTCLKFNANYGDCHWVNISNSIFNSYNNFRFSWTISSLVTKPLNYKLGVETFILKARSLEGPIIITNNTFKNFVTIKRDSQSVDTTSTTLQIACSKTNIPTTFSNVPTIENIAMAVRRVSSLFKQTPASTPNTKNLYMSLSSCFDIRDLKKGLIMYQNTFQSIYSHTAPVLHLYGFENTLQYPIILDSNVIKNNFAQDYAAAFYIGKTGRDYATLGCDGVFIFNNTISKNIGCPYALGTAMVLCDTDPSDVLYSVNATTTPYNPIFDDAFNYHILRNQKGDYHPFTQNLTRTFFNNLKANSTGQTATLHPYRVGYPIITNGVTVKNNTFSANQAWLSTGIIVQGAYTVTIDQNNFVNGSVFTLESLSEVWQESPLVTILKVALPAKVYKTLATWHKSQSPLWIKLADTVSITNCLFDNNKGANIGDYWMGASITLERLIGMNSPVIQNCIFRNHTGLFNYDSLALAEAGGVGVTDFEFIKSTTYLEIYITQNTQPLITVSFYEGTFEFNYTNSPISPPEYRYAEDYVTNSTLIIDSCTFENNAFNETSWAGWWTPYHLFANQSFIVKGFVINETIEYGGYSASTEASLASNFYAYYNKEGRPTQKRTLIAQNSKFINNTVHSGQPLFANTIFDDLQVLNSTFINNTIDTFDSSTIMQSNSAFFVARNDSLYRQNNDNNMPYITMSLKDLTFVNNSGAIFMSNYSTVNEIDAQNTLFSFDNLNVSGHISKVPLFYFDATANIFTNNLYLSNITTKVATFLMKNMSNLAIGNITIDGIDNLQSKLNIASDSQSNFKASDALSLCLALVSTTNITVENFSCLRSNFEGHQFYAGLQLGTCAYTNTAYNTTFTNFTCNSSSYIQNDYANQQTLVLLKDIQPITNAAVIKDSVIGSNTAYQGVLLVNGFATIDSGTVFQSNNFTTSGVAGTVRSQLIINSVTFKDNYGGSLIENEEGNTTIMFTEFTNNSATSATVLSLSFGTASITDCSITKNYATMGSLTSIASVTQLKIANTIFQENEMTKGVLNLDQSTLTLDDSQFLENYGALTTPNIQIYQGSVVMNNIQFVGVSNWTRTQGVWRILQADFLVAASSSVSITGLTATGARASYGAIYLEDGSGVQEIKDSTFSNGYGVYSGAITTLTPLSVSSSTFTNNTGTQRASSILADTATSLSVNNLNIQDTAGIAIDADTKEVSISDVIMTGTGGLTYQSGIQISSFTQASISNVEIRGMSYFQGGGMSLVSSLEMLPNITIDFLTIADCTAVNGGGLYIVDIYNVSLTNALLDNNRAILSEGGSGGAIFYDANSSSATLEMNSNVTIKNNYASEAGGAIYFDAQEVHAGSGVTLQNNSATYGDDIGSYPTSFGVTNASKELLLEFLQKYDPYSDYISQVESLTGRVLSDNVIVSGVRLFPPIVFGIYDEHGQLVTSDDTSTLTVSTVPSADSNGTEPVLVENSTFTAFKGHFILYPFSVAYTPNSTFELSFTSPSINEKLKYLDRTSKPDTSGNTFSLPFTSDSCPLGTRVSSNNECTSCPFGFYTILLNSEEDCHTCPAGEAVCEGGSAVGPAVGYWRLGAMYDGFIECRNDEACLGYSITDPEILKTAYCEENYNSTFCLTGWCSEKYKGNLCSTCRGNFARSSDDNATCGTCNKSWWLYGSVVVVCIGAVVVVMVLVRSAIFDEDTYIEKKKKELEERAKRHAAKKPKAKTSSYRGSRIPSREGSRLGSREGSFVGVTGYDPSKQPHSPKRGLEKRYSKGMSSSFEGEPTRQGNGRASLSSEHQGSPTKEAQNDQSNLGLMSPMAQHGHEKRDSRPTPLGFVRNYQDAKLDSSPDDQNNDDSKVINFAPEDRPRMEKESYSKIASPHNLEASRAGLILGANDTKDLNFTTLTENKLRGNESRNHGFEKGMTLNKSSLFYRKAEQFGAADGDDDVEIDQILNSSIDEIEVDTKQNGEHGHNDQDDGHDASPRSALSSQPGAERGEHKDSTVICFGEKKYTKEEILDHHAKKINVLSIFFKILINYVQLISILYTFQFNWPGELEDLFDINVKINLAFIDVFSVDCLFKDTSLTTSVGMPTFFIKVLVYSLVPIVLSVFGALVWIILYFVKVRKEKAKKQQLLERTRNRIMVTVIVICFFMHSSLMQVAIASMKCVELGSDTKPARFLDKDLSVECWGDVHMKWFLSISLPTLIFWGVIVPVLALSRLVKYREKLLSYKIKSRYGWLYEGLNSRNFYWEFVVTYRKVALIALSVFLVDVGSTIAATATLSIMIASFFFHSFQQPYRSYVLNRLESISLFSNTLVAYCALFFLLPNVSEWARLVLFAALAVSFCAFLGYWAYYLLREQSRLLLQRAWFEKHFGKCLRKIASKTNSTQDSSSFSKGQSGSPSATRLASFDGSESNLNPFKSSKILRQSSGGSSMSATQFFPTPNTAQQQNDSMENSDLSPIVSSPLPKRSRFYNPKESSTTILRDMSVDTLAVLTKKQSQNTSQKGLMEDQRDLQVNRYGSTKKSVKSIAGTLKTANAEPTQEDKKATLTALDKDVPENTHNDEKDSRSRTDTRKSQSRVMGPSKEEIVKSQGNEAEDKGDQTQYNPITM